jgi:hypothetical protein
MNWDDDYGKWSMRDKLWQALRERTQESEGLYTADMLAADLGICIGWIVSEAPSTALAELVLKIAMDAIANNSNDLVKMGRVPMSAVQPMIEPDDDEEEEDGGPPPLN